MPRPVLIMLLCCGLAPGFSEESRLDRAKREIHKPDPSPPSSQGSHSGSSSNSSGHYHHNGSSSQYDDDDDSWFDFFALIIEVTVSRFTWETKPPYNMVGQVPHPYHEGYDGYYAPVEVTDAASTLALRCSTDVTWIDERTQRYAVGLECLISAFSIRTDWARLFEERSDGSHSTLNISTIEVQLGLLTFEKLRLDLGVGGLITHDAIGSESGGWIAGDLEIFPMRPFVITARAGTGSVGPSNVAITQLTAQLGATWRQFEVYGGWHSDNIAGYVFEGPMAGIRLWY